MKTIREYIDILEAIQGDDSGQDSEKSVIDKYNDGEKPSTPEEQRAFTLLDQLAYFRVVGNNTFTKQVKLGFYSIAIVNRSDVFDFTKENMPKFFKTGGYDVCLVAPRIYKAMPLQTFGNLDQALKYLDTLVTQESKTTGNPTSELKQILSQDPLDTEFDFNSIS